MRRIYRRIVDDAIISRETRTRDRIRADIMSVIEDELSKVVDDVHPVEMYIFSKSIRSSYKNRNLCHVRVVDKIAYRNKTGEFVRDLPVAGDRVEYVVLHGIGKVSDRSEDLEFFRDKLENSTRKLDRSWYVNNTFNGLNQLTSLFIPPNWLRKKIDKCCKELQGQQSGHKKITCFFQKKRMRRN